MMCLKYFRMRGRPDFQSKKNNRVKMQHNDRIVLVTSCVMVSVAVRLIAQRIFTYTCHVTDTQIKMPLMMGDV